jgi:hypothetical protein
LLGVHLGLKRNHKNWAKESCPNAETCFNESIPQPGKEVLDVLKRKQHLMEPVIFVQPNATRASLGSSLFSRRASAQ